MKVELPELKRCCFCIPLRYGLIAWGYIKLAVLLLFTVFASIEFGYMIRAIHYSSRPGYPYVGNIVITVLLLLLMLTDICFTIMFIVGGHRKSIKLLHIYFIYNIVLMCLYTFFFTFATVMELVSIGRYIKYMPHGIATFVPIIHVKLILGACNLGIQVYIILLIRSEVNKLRNSSKYRFSNPTVANAPTIENGINEQGITYAKGVSNENGNDTQFEGIINDNKKADREDFKYNKM